MRPHSQGYGFIIGEHGEDVFAYLINIYTKRNDRRRPVLISGESVEYSLAVTNKGLDAREISLPGGFPFPSQDPLCPILIHRVAFHCHYYEQRLYSYAYDNYLSSTQSIPESCQRKERTKESEWVIQHDDALACSEWHVLYPVCRPSHYTTPPCPPPANPPSRKERPEYPSNYYNCYQQQQPYQCLTVSVDYPRQFVNPPLAEVFEEPPPYADPERCVRPNEFRRPPYDAVRQMHPVYPCPPRPRCDFIDMHHNNDYAQPPFFPYYP